MNLKNVLILGDSYSTFEGFVPQGNAIYYSENGRPETDVRRVDETWWHQLMSETGSNLILNDSWSGSTIGYTGYNNSDCSETSSFICRFEKMVRGGFFKENEINTVLVFGGTNDSWSNAPLGSLKFADWEKKDLYCVLPAIAYFFKTLHEQLPDTEIICLINTELKPEITEAFNIVCEKYGIKKIQFEHIDKNCGHPTIQGMKDIKNHILNQLG